MIKVYHVSKSVDHCWCLGAFYSYFCFFWDYPLQLLQMKFSKLSIYQIVMTSKKIKVVVEKMVKCQILLLLYSCSIGLWKVRSLVAVILGINFFIMGWSVFLIEPKFNLMCLVCVLNFCSILSCRLWSIYFWLFFSMWRIHKLLLLMHCLEAAGYSFASSVEQSKVKIFNILL